MNVSNDVIYGLHTPKKILNSNKFHYPYLMQLNIFFFSENWSVDFTGLSKGSISQKRKVGELLFLNSN